MYQHLLVPIDASPLSAANVQAAVQLARSLGARITFFHATADYVATSEGALLHASDPA
jgi:nucleotide-binding universal stress UspA family protein